MTKQEFAQIEAVAKQAGYQPTRAQQKAACASIAGMPATKKVEAVLEFVDREARVRTTSPQGDWVAWRFVHGVIGARERLPWTRAAIEKVLGGVIAEPRVLPPELVARAVEQLVATDGPPDAALRDLVQRAAASMWPPGATESASYKKAAAKLTALLAAT